MLSDGGEHSAMDDVETVVPKVETEERCDVTRCQPVDDSEDLADLGPLECVEWDVKEL